MKAITKCKDRFVETEIDDEIVVMELGRGEFFSLAGTGSAIWRLIDGERDRTSLLAMLAEDYGEPAEQIAGDVDEFLAQLSDGGLIEIA